MRCASLERDVADRARGVRLDGGRDTDLDRHLRECPRCAARLESERAISAGLRRLADDTRVPAVEPDAQQRILAVFDDVMKRPAARVRLRPIAAIVLLPAAAAVAWMVATARRGPEESRLVPQAAIQPPVAPQTDAPQFASAPAAAAPAAAAPQPRRIRSGRRDTPRPVFQDTTEFIVWPGAAALPAFESGQLMRMSLPVSMVVSLGLVPPSPDGDVVQADVLVGQDGFARAVRLVP